MTKKRILFVDDEPLVLQGLQRMLRPLRNEWEMEFVESGPKALARLGQAAFDVVVADMRMPGMNGAELLQEVMKRHPKTVRLILSGHADKDLILKCVGSAHQFLSKPCEPEALKATVLRATAVEGSLQNERLKELVGQMDRLPSLPTLYGEMIEKLNQPEVSLEAVAETIAKDIAMTAQILKLVNSAFFGLRRQISSPQEAVSYLGLATVKSLVLSIHAFSQFQPVQLGGLTMAALWSHGLSVGSGAKQIAQLEGAAQKVMEDCFVAGMLHDIGKLVLAANLPAEYGQFIQQAEREGKPLWVAEEAVFGANHADVGGYLLGLWGLPVPVVEAISLHHAPSRSLNLTFSPLTAVHVANELERTRQQPSGSDETAGIDRDYLTGLKLLDRLPVWRDALQKIQPTTIA